MKFCKDCKYMKKTHRCAHPTFTDINPVTGNLYNYTCKKLRGTQGMCSAKGFFFESKIEEKVNELL